MHLSYGENKLQIIYCHQRVYWIVAATINNCRGEILVVDPIFKSTDSETRRIITLLSIHIGVTDYTTVKPIEAKR